MFNFTFMNIEQNLNKNNKSRRGLTKNVLPLQEDYTTLQVSRKLPYDFLYVPLSLGDTELPVTGGLHKTVQNVTERYRYVMVMGRDSTEGAR